MSSKADPRNKILFLDIETVPGTAYVWKTGDQHVSLEQLITDSSVTMVGYRWYRTKARIIHVTGPSTERAESLKRVARLMQNASAVCTYNGKAFDIPKLYGEFLRHKVPVPPRPASIDLYDVARGLGYASSKLAHVSPTVIGQHKINPGGFELWRRVASGDKAARLRMARYCARDVNLLVPLYEKLIPLIRNHPIMRTTLEGCPACGSHSIQRRGYRRTKRFVIERLACVSCGSWFDGTRTVPGKK